MIKDMFESDCIDEAWLWYFDDTGWHTAYDQQEWINVEAYRAYNVALA
jgi:hypothetical protein